MRRVLVVLTFVVAAAPAVGAQTIVAGPAAAQLTAGIGDRLTIPVAVNMTGAPGILLGSYGARLTWNPALMQYVDAAAGTFANPVVNTDSVAQGVLRFAAANAQGASAVPVLTSVTLEVVALASADTFRMTFDEMDAANTFQDLLPFLTVTSGAFCAGSVYGDVNGDGAIQALDAQIVLMHAVGQAVADTSGGDVDSDSIVGTRDALVILSQVIGLDVSMFRVGTLVSGVCTPTAPDTVTVVPATVTLAQGDTFRVHAQVRDSAGILVAGRSLVWSSSNPTVATVDSNGTVAALLDGAVTITAAVSPSLTAQGSVTVGPRTRWRVDPAGAQGRPSELGSDTYPFSTIAAAVARAAPGDTISVAVGRYAESLDASKALVFYGDSGAMGPPVISTPNRPAGTLSGPGRHVVHRFAIEDAQSGLDIRGDTADLRSVFLRSMRGPGVVVVGANRVDLQNVWVQGVRGTGISVDSSLVARLAQVTVSGVTTDIDTLPAAGVFVRADSVYLDTLTVTGVAGYAVVTRDAERTRVRRADVSYAQFGVQADSGVTLEVLDSTVVRFIEQGHGISGDVDSLRVFGARVEDVASAAARIGPANFTYHEIRILDAAFRRVGQGLSSVVFGNRAEVRRTIIEDVGGDALAPRPDTLIVDSVTIRRALGDGVEATSADWVAISATQVEDVEGRGISVAGFWGSITGTTVRNSGSDGIYAAIDTLTLTADSVWNAGDYGFYSQFGVHATARNVFVQGSGREGAYFYSYDRLDLAHSRVDSAGQISSSPGLEAFFVDTVRVDSSSFRYSRGAGIEIIGSLIARVRHDTVVGNFRLGSPLGGQGLGIGALSVEDADSVFISHNVVRDNYATSTSVFLDAASQFAQIDSNTVRGPHPGLYVNGYDSASARVDVFDNGFTGRLDGNVSYQVYGFDVGRMEVTGNTFDSIAGHGVSIQVGDSMIVDNNQFPISDDRGSTTRLIWGHRIGGASVTNNIVTCGGLPSSAVGIYLSRLTGSVSGNTVTNCARGVEAINDVAAAFDTVSIVSNTVGGAGEMIGGIVVRQRLVSTVSGNAITDGVFSEGAVAILGVRFQRAPRTSVSADTVFAGSGRGIRVEWADTADIQGNVVTNLGSLYADTTLEAGIMVRNVFGPTRVVGNTVTMGENGISLADTLRAVRVDTNLVADHTNTGIQIRNWVEIVGGTDDTIRGRHNSIRRNTAYGVFSSNGQLLFPSNNIEGNGVGFRAAAPDTVDVSNSWWGDPAGPRCDSIAGCAALSPGDSLSGPGLLTQFAFSPWAADTVVGTPPGAPPFGTGSPFRVTRVLRPRPLAAGPQAPAPPPARPRREPRPPVDENRRP